jgi:carbon monoxide dehydrogenase subunit G
MRLEGKNLIRAGRNRVWAFLNDPNVLAKAIPGCEELKSEDENLYTGTVKLGIGPVKGSYQFKIRVAESSPPESWELHFEGKGLRGFAKMTAPVKLVPHGEKETEVNWQGAGEVGGVLAAAGDRILIGISRMLINQFFKVVENELSRGEIGNETGSL